MGRWTQVSRDSARVAQALRGEALARSLPQCRPPRVAAQKAGFHLMVRERLISATAQQEGSACGRPLLGASVCLKPVTADEYSANSMNKDLNQKTNRALTIL